MSELDQHITKPDLGVVSTDLFIYDTTKPGTGGLVSVVLPPLLEERAVIFAQTGFLEISFTLSRVRNTGKVTLTRRDSEAVTDHKTFRLMPEFLTADKVSLTVLFNNWKIVALIDGEPLYVAGS